ncbi:MAG: sterol transfer family [Gaiellales bacterium]|nr:sterol transfer family [Gaiellales bacterium]
MTAAAEFFAALPERLSAVCDGPGTAVIAFALADAPAGGWTLRLGPDGSQVDPGTAAADVTVRCSREVWEQLCDGRMAPQTAWAVGLLAVDGDLRLAQSLRAVLGI